MRRMFSLAKVLASTLVAAVGCGRVGFDSGGPFAQLAATLELDTECGAMPPATGSLSISNAGNAELEIMEASSTGGFMVTTALPLLIAPGASASIDILPPLAVVGTDRSGDRRTGRLTLVTNEAAGSREVALGATVIGAELTVTGPGGAPLSLDLTGTGGACPTPAQALVTNSGNRAVEVAVSGSSGLAPFGFSSGTVEANSTVSFTVKAMTSAPCSDSGALLVAVTGSTCTAPQTSIAGSFVITGAAMCGCS